MSVHSRVFAAMALGGVALAGALPSLAADAPATAPAASGVQSMHITVAEVKGIVQVRANDQAPWQPAKVNMVVDEGAEFRTGPRSSVTCVIPPDQTLTLDRLGTVKIAEAIKTGNKVKTDMVMKYGRATYDIEAAGAEHESVIRSPSSTLAVRGTKVRLYDQPPFVPQAESFHGRASFRNAQRELRFGGKSLTTVANDKNSSADTALGQQVVDPRSASIRTASDAAFIANQTSLGATFTFDRLAQIAVVRNGPGPLSDADLAKPGALPGSLDFVLRWNGPGNLNLLVSDVPGIPAAFIPQEVLYPGFGLNTSKSGGVIPYDDRGGKRGGMEIAFWGGSFPQGSYGLGAISLSSNPINYTLNIFDHGKPVTIFAVVGEEFVMTTQLTGTLGGKAQVGAIAFIPPFPDSAASKKKASRQPADATVTQTSTRAASKSVAASAKPVRR